MRSRFNTAVIIAITGLAAPAFAEPVPQGLTIGRLMFQALTPRRPALGNDFGAVIGVGLLFICHQRDPRDGFIKTFEPMTKLDALDQYTTHTGGGLFACPPGA